MTEGEKALWRTAFVGYLNREKRFIPADYACYNIAIEAAVHASNAVNLSRILLENYNVDVEVLNMIKEALR